MSNPPKGPQMNQERHGTSTHHERIETDDQTPEPPTSEFKIGDKVCWAGESLGREVVGIYADWLWVARTLHPVTVKSDRCTPWVDPQRERLIDLLQPSGDNPVTVTMCSQDRSDLADYLLDNGVTVEVSE